MSGEFILNTQDTAGWQAVYETQLIAQPTGLSNGSLYPIGRHTVPVDFDADVIVVGTSSSTAKPSWRLGCFLSAYTVISGVGNTEIATGMCPFGLKLFKFTEYSGSYRLGLYVPRWHQDLDIKIWKYLGNPADDRQLLQDLITRLQG